MTDRTENFAQGAGNFKPFVSTSGKVHAATTIGRYGALTHCGTRARPTRGMEAPAGTGLTCARCKSSVAGERR